jgi:hypothetical protein
MGDPGKTFSHVGFDLDVDMDSTRAIVHTGYEEMMINLS